MMNPYNQLKIIKMIVINFQSLKKGKNLNLLKKKNKILKIEFLYYLFINHHKQTFVFLYS